MSASESNSFDIAGDRKNLDWLNEDASSRVGKEPEFWERIFADYFVQRLRTRYLEPIRRIMEPKRLKGEGFHQQQPRATRLKIMEPKRLKGEGFSIVAIQCSLIEFLQSTVDGINYKYGNPKGEHEYGDSRECFKKFLMEQQPFASTFEEAIAQDFYKNIRCSVLHEARTSGGWVIRAKPAGLPPCFEWRKQAHQDSYDIHIRTPPCLIDITNPDQKILYRNDFTAALWQFIQGYGAQLQNDQGYQEAFIRKFNALATP